ncbi:MAG: hypothetical protein Kow00121_33590 [Elainellaceae cyanobacterium]
MKFLSYILRSPFRKGALVFATGAFLLTACQEPGQQATAPVEEEVGVVEDETEIAPETGVTETTTEEPFTVAQQIEENVELNELTGNVEDYIGQTISVRSDVANTVGESNFLLQSDSWFGGEEVLAINATGQPFVLPEDVELQVTGEVQQFVLVDVEREYGVDLDPEIYAEYEQQPVIIAESIALAPDPAEVTEDPERFYNQVIAVEGDIGEFESAGIFRLEEDQLFGGEGLLVLSNIEQITDAAAEAGQIEDDSRVVVTGVLRPYVRAEFERDYDFWGADVLGELEAEYETQPVLVAEDVYGNAEE